MGSLKPITSVAIVGGGIAGLAAAIALGKFPHISLTVFERHPEPTEVSAGISLSTNAWRVLDLLGAADGVKGFSKDNTTERIAYNGQIVRVTPKPEFSEADKRGAIRARRTRLHSALLAKVPRNIIQYNKKLVKLENIPEGGVRLVFQDQTEALADLVVGADGIRSTVRQGLFPDHHLSFTGGKVWRTLLPKSAIAHIPEITDSTAWWWAKDGHVYISGVDEESEFEDPLYEISIRRYHEPEVPGETVPWAMPATNKRVISHFLDYDQRIRDALAAVTEGNWREFSVYAGPRLAEITGWDKVVLIGDASHPLQGAFGSGATFAMEDAWILARAIEYTHLSTNSLRDALEIFQEIREPFYTKAHNWLDEREARVKDLVAQNLDFETLLKARLNLFFGTGGDLDFVYKSDIVKVWKDYLKSQKSL